MMWSRRFGLRLLRCGAQCGCVLSAGLGARAVCESNEPSTQGNPFAVAKKTLEGAYVNIYDTFVRPYAEPSRERLLPDLPAQIKGREKPTLVVGLDGVLIQSTWSRQYGWRYVKRPGVDQFLAALVPYYELVLWTDAQNTAEPVVDQLDPRRLLRHRLYRDTTSFQKGHHVKDLSVLNRELSRVVIIDTSPEAFMLHPKHGVLVTSYDSEKDKQKEDDQLTKLIPFLQYLAVTKAPDLSEELANIKSENQALTAEQVGKAFETKLAELKATGKIALGPRGAVSVKGRSPTLWERWRSGGA